jgi:thymidylate synthase (FAD)
MSASADYQRSLEILEEVRCTSEITVVLVKSPSDDDDIVRAARVSTYGDGSLSSRGSDTGAQKLISYLMRNRHGSPFEHTFFTFYVHAPIFTLRHLMRHRTWSFNEESARYRELSPVFYQPSPERELRQAGKPGHYQYVVGESGDHETVLRETVEVYRRAWHGYQEMLRR